MKFWCHKCKKILNRDMRINANKNCLDKRGYYMSYCERRDVMAHCKPVLK